MSTKHKPTLVLAIGLALAVGMSTATPLVAGDLSKEEKLVKKLNKRLDKKKKKFLKKLENGGEVRNWKTVVRYIGGRSSRGW